MHVALRSFLRLRRYADVLRVADRLFACGGDQESTRFARAVARAKTGQLKAAVAELVEVATDSSAWTAEARFELGLARAKLGLIDEARDDFLALLEMDPFDERAAAQLVRQLVRLNAADGKRGSDAAADERLAQADALSRYLDQLKAAHGAGSRAEHAGAAGRADEALSGARGRSRTSWRL